MKKFALGLGVLLLAVVAYMAFWPVPIAPVSWKAPAAPGYVGPHAANQKLAGLKMIDLGGEEGPEHVVLARDGKLYTTVLSGNILRMNPDGSGREVFANTGGRVLGFDFDATGNLIAADAIKGLLSISPDRKITVLTDAVGGDPIRYADAVVVARNVPVAEITTRTSPRSTLPVRKPLAGLCVRPDHSHQLAASTITRADSASKRCKVREAEAGRAIRSPEGRK